MLYNIYKKFIYCYVEINQYFVLRVFDVPFVAVVVVLDDNKTLLLSILLQNITIYAT